MKIKLGKDHAYPSEYNPELLDVIDRADLRSQLFPKSTNLPFQGHDLWTAYELSWLNKLGLPRVAIAEIWIPCDSSFMVESKSFKYYLNSFNQSRFLCDAELESCIAKDLSERLCADVQVEIFSLDDYVPGDTPWFGQCLDDLSVSIDDYKYRPQLLCSDQSESVESQALYSHLLRTNCPVTNQPDWASLWIEYSGPKIVPESFLQYLVSFRQYQDFHEHCVETIFADLVKHCGVYDLSVYARYTRRGGIDINPFRSHTNRSIPNFRCLRQ